MQCMLIYIQRYREVVSYLRCIYWTDSFIHTCPRIKLKGAGNFWSSEGGEGGTRQNCRGPLILSFIAFLCDNFQNFPNFEIPLNPHFMDTYGTNVSME